MVAFTISKEKPSLKRIIFEECLYLENLSIKAYNLA